MTTLSTNWKQLQEEMKDEKAKMNEKDGKHLNDGNAGLQRKRAAKLARRKAKRKKIQGKEEGMRVPEEEGTSSAQLDIVTNATSSSQQEEGELTKTVGLDCEYVGVGMDGCDNMLARVSIVNMHGHCIYDKYVKPREKVTDYRTAVSGIRPNNLMNGEDFQKVQLEVHKLLSDRIVVGHSLKNDFKVLNLSHTRKLIRDTATYFPFRKALNTSKTPSLKLLAKQLLGIDVQRGEHDSIIDARVAMRLYVLHRKQWEKDIRRYGRK